MNTLLLQTVIALCLLATSISADDKISEQESQRYYLELMQKARTFKLEPNAGRKYLRGVWRLDQKAHVGGGHHTKADKGDDVSLICNDTRLMQVDFNRHSDESTEVTEQLAELRANADGSLSIGEGRSYIPLDDTHMAVAAYDYIVVLQRVSGMAKSSDEKAGKPAAEVLKKIDPEVVAKAGTENGSKKNPTTDLTDAEVVAKAFITALANNNVNEAAKYIIPADRDELEKEMEKGMPPLPKDPKIQIKIKDNGIQADVSLLNAQKPASGPPFGFDMKLSEGKWWIVK